jgi:hypothetical protein
LLKRDLFESTTGPEARLYRKSANAAMKLCYLGHLITENRHGLIVASQASLASTTAERKTGLERARRLREQGFRPRAMGADKAYNEEDFVEGLGQLGIQAHAPAAGLGGRPASSTGGLCPQSKETQADRTLFWLDEDGRHAAQDVRIT